MKHQTLITVLRWLAIVVILRVLFTILANYPDYFPPRFDSLFLEGREATFTGLYRVAFYLHIVTSPFVLLNGLLLLSSYVQRHYSSVHRVMGRIQVMVLLLFVLPSSLVMSQQAYAGWLAGLSFIVLSLATATCAIVGVIHARHRRFALHRRWMIRTYLLICSAVVLRIMSGAMGLLDLPNPEMAYVIAAWSSWVFPLAVYEVMDRSSRVPGSFAIDIKRWQGRGCTQSRP